MWQRRKEADAYTDWGRYHQLPDDLSWVDHKAYPGTQAYRKDYQGLAQLISVTRYLSLGSGLGRQIALAYECFPQLQSVVSVDHKMFLHQSIKRLPIALTPIRSTIARAILALQLKNYQFDLVAVENVPNHGIVEALIPSLKGLLIPNGLLAFVGDTYPTSGLWQDPGFTNLLNSHPWITVEGLFQRK